MLPGVPGWPPGNRTHERAINAKRFRVSQREIRTIGGNGILDRLANVRDVGSAPATTSAIAGHRKNYENHNDY